MPPKPNYLILPGGRFRMPDESIKTAGDDIYLPDDIADLHPGLLQRLPDAETDSSAEPAATPQLE